jgi:hypothetical protein
MKTLLILALAFVALAASSGLSVAQVSSPLPPNALKLTAGLTSPTGCAVTARVSNTNNTSVLYPNLMMTITIVPSVTPSVPIVKSYKTDAQGAVNFKILHGQSVTASVSIAGRTTNLTSNKLTCK